MEQFYTGLWFLIVWFLRIFSIGFTGCVSLAGFFIYKNKKWKVEIGIKEVIIFAFYILSILSWFI